MCQFSPELLSLRDQQALDHADEVLGCCSSIVVRVLKAFGNDLINRSADDDCRVCRIAALDPSSLIGGANDVCQLSPPSRWVVVTLIVRHRLNDHAGVARMLMQMT